MNTFHSCDFKHLLSYGITKIPTLSFNNHSGSGNTAYSLFPTYDFMHLLSYGITKYLLFLLINHSGSGNTAYSLFPTYDFMYLLSYGIIKYLLYLLIIIQVPEIQPIAYFLPMIISTIKISILILPIIYSNCLMFIHLYMDKRLFLFCILQHSILNCP